MITSKKLYKRLEYFLIHYKHLMNTLWYLYKQSEDLNIFWNFLFCGFSGFWGFVGLGSESRDSMCIESKKIQCESKEVVHWISESQKIQCALNLRRFNDTVIKKTLQSSLDLTIFTFLAPLLLDALTSISLWLEDLLLKNIYWQHY